MTGSHCSKRRRRVLLCGDDRSGADLCLDNCGEEGDAAVAYPGWGGKVGPTSVVTGTFLVNRLICGVVERFLAEGLTPPVYMSANLPGGDEHNRRLEEQYRGRITLL